MSGNCRVSVIIPTRDRKNTLRRTVGSLARQTFPPMDYEVVIVDDGSTDGTPMLVDEPYPFALKYLRREGGGATAARNEGAMNSGGSVLVFVDDDITVSPDTLAALYQDCICRTRAVVMGRLRAVVTPEEIKASVFAQLNADSPDRAALRQADSEVRFSECKTGLLAIKRQDFFDLGMFQDPTGGWPNWDDVDFGFRASQAGFRFRQCTQAVGEHRDYSLSDLAASCLRWQRASKSAVRLFQKHPDIESNMPMFYDKTPIAWERDSPRLILRKLSRRVASSRPVLGSMERVARALERRYPTPVMLRPLYRWIIGGYIFRGFQQGLKESKR